MGGYKYNSTVRSMILADFSNGLSQKEISNKYSIHKSTISRVVASGSSEWRHSGGRSRATTSTDDRQIKIFIKKNPKATAREVRSATQLDVSLSTIKRRAIEAGLNTYRVTKKPFVSEKNRKLRLCFAHAHKNWSQQQWRNVLWSDESKFNLRGSDCKSYVRRPRGTKYNPKYTTATVKHGGGNIMVWGCFSGNGIGPIKRIEGTMTAVGYSNILSNVMLPYAEWNMPLAWTFQHDNDPKHSSRLVKSWLMDNKVRVMSWPAQSPDLNPIENMWMMMKRKIGKKIFKNGAELYTEVEKEWNNISPDYINKLIESMPKRCQAVIRSNGYATKY